VTARAWLIRSLLVVGVLIARPAPAQEDPGATGPYAVSVTEYSEDDPFSSGQITNIEVLAQVHYPTNLGNGPYPLVVLVHGHFTTCYGEDANGQFAVSSDWPCLNDFQPIPSYQGYEYLASLLASHGMIVTSISANGINAKENAVSTTMGSAERAELIQHHLDMWYTFSTTGGSFGTQFVGKVDLSRVGMMGHSRGGEGIIWHYELNASQGSPYGSKALLPLAPVNAFRHHVNDVPVGVLLAYCDGDVHDLAGVAYFDDARYDSETDATPKYTFLGLGANHNYFNTFWTPELFEAGFDDWIFRDILQDDPWCGTASGIGRLTSAQQRGFGAAYMAAFFRRHLLGAKQFDGILRGQSPPPPSAQTSLVYSGYHPAAFDRKDLNRLWISSDLTENWLEGDVNQLGLATYQQCGDWTGLQCASTGTDAHFPSLSALELGWESLGASYSNELPKYKRDVSNFSTLQFRAALDYSDDDRNPADQPQDLRVQLVDGAGHTFAVKVSTYSGLLYYPPAVTNINQILQRLRPASVMNTVRIPLTAFAGVDKTNLTAVNLLFDQKAKGTVLVSDIAFADEGTTAAEKWLVSSGVVVAD
jgi:hypothetical protein